MPDPDDCMSLERKDVRVKLSAEDHGGLALLAEVDGLELAEWAEAELVKVVRKRIHAATVIAERARRLGLSGNGRESQGIAGTGRDSPGRSGNGRE